MSNLDRIFNFLAPVKNKPLHLVSGMEGLQPPAPAPLSAEELKNAEAAKRAVRQVQRDAEIAEKKSEALYLEELNKVQVRIDALRPPKRSLLGSLTGGAQKKGGKPQSSSLLARFWQMLPMKPALIPIVLVLGIVLLIKQC